MNEVAPKIIKGLKIDPQIFTFKFSCKCTGECCHYGVYADLKEYETITAIQDKIIPLMDETQPTLPELWFEEPEPDTDFDSGVAVGTEIFNNKCVFLDKNGLCVLQRLANIEGVDKWEYKPHYCILYPFTIYENTLMIDTDHMNRLKTCNNQPHENTTMYEHCQDELIHLLGKDGFDELEKYRLEYLTMNTKEK